MKNSQHLKTMPVIYHKVNTDFVHYSNFLLGSSPIKALHYHNKVEIGVCLSGKGIAYVNDKEYSFKEGDIQSIPSGVPHLSTSKEQSSRWIWVTFSPIEVLKKAGITDPETVMQITNHNNVVCGVYDKDKYPNLTRAIRYIIDCVHDDAKDTKAIAFAIGSYLVECAKIMKKDQTLIEGQTDKTPIERITDYISENLDDNKMLCEKALANKMGVSVATLNRAFISQTGYPPKTFIMRYRMATAEWLLVSSSLSIIEISLRVGYADTSGFNRVFKKFFNISPYQYRKHYKK